MTSNPYGPRFWFTYLANVGLMVAVSLLFRYADFVRHLGGSEETLGLITGIGMVGAITARCIQGVAIDRYGSGRIWVLSLCMLVICLLGHLTVGALDPPLIYLLRILYTVSLAGAFGASITYVSLRAPAERMGEIIGMLGSSGFIGMAIGPAIGDWLFAGSLADAMVTRLFYCSAAAALFSLGCATAATWRDWGALPGDPHHEQSINPWPLVRRYHPGWTLLVAFAMGVSIGMPGTFLSAFAAEKGIAELGWFWMPYAGIAFVVRIFTRTLPDRWGTRPTILLGLFCLAMSMLTYPWVASARGLVLPAALGGFGHAFLFPATVAEGNHAFPIQLRGLATTLMLTMFDVGLLIGQPIFGWSVELSRDRGNDGYAVSFTGLAGMLLIVAVIYLFGKPGKRRHQAAVNIEQAQPTSADETLTPDAPQDAACSG